jgi:hypothetical protein
MFYYYPSNAATVYKIDRAKYNVCKWIDAQCKQYRLQYNGEEPELTETHNDIYDFILHKVDGQSYTRIHRGDFTGRTHTLEYRPFSKSHQFVGPAKLMISTPTCADTAAADTESNVTETFTIHLKSPDHFFLEKNEFLDKKFLQWKLYNECGRKDIATRIGLPFTNYTVYLYYNQSSTDDTVEFITLNDSNSLLIGKEYIVKVDSVLRCPVFDSNDKQVFDIDGILSQYYSDSDSGSSGSSTAVSDIEDAEGEDEEGEDAEGEDAEGEDAEGEDEEGEDDRKDAEDSVDPEFEILE